MVPFQTLLALLAALILMSCSQTPPPKGHIDGLAANASPSPTVAGPMTTDKDPNTIIKPDAKQETEELDAETSVLKLDSSVANQLTLAFVGQDAQRLYRMTEIEPRLEKVRLNSLQSEPAEPEALSKNYVKGGQHYLCTQNGLGMYACALAVMLIDGEVANLQDPKKIKSKPEYAFQHPVKQIKGTFLNFDANASANTSKDKTTPFFQINLINENAKQVFDALKVGEIAGRKRGKRVNCIRDLKLDPSDAKAYGCILYGDLSTGSFEEIQP